MLESKGMNNGPLSTTKKERCLQALRIPAVDTPCNVGRFTRWIQLQRRIMWGTPGVGFRGWVVWKRPAMKSESRHEKMRCSGSCLCRSGLPLYTSIIKHISSFSSLCLINLSWRPPSPCSLVTADTRISLMVNQRFWGRECRQVLGHLQPPQMSLEEIRCSFADASYSRIVGGLLMELRYGYAGYAMGMPQKSWEWKQKKDRFPSGPKPYSSRLLLRSWEICLQNSAWDVLSRAWCGFRLACW